MGRPTDYTYELAIEICDAIATDTKGLRRLCAVNPHWPTRQNISKWLNRHEAFRSLYAQAKLQQTELLVDDILEIADDARSDIITRENKDGLIIETCNNEFVNRSRLRIDSRKWIASKLMPKVYGDKIEKTTDDESKALMSKIIDKL